MDRRWLMCAFRLTSRMIWMHRWMICWKGKVGGQNGWSLRRSRNRDFQNGNSTIPQHNRSLKRALDTTHTIRNFSSRTIQLWHWTNRSEFRKLWKKAKLSNPLFQFAGFKRADNDFFFFNFGQRTDHLDSNSSTDLRMRFVQFFYSTAFALCSVWLSRLLCAASQQTLKMVAECHWQRCEMIDELRRVFEGSLWIKWKNRVFDLNAILIVFQLELSRLP